MSKFNEITEELVNEIIAVYLNLKELDDLSIPDELSFRCPTCPCECCDKENYEPVIIYMVIYTRDVKELKQWYIRLSQYIDKYWKIREEYESKTKNLSESDIRTLINKNKYLKSIYKRINNLKGKCISKFYYKFRNRMLGVKRDNIERYSSNSNYERENKHGFILDKMVVIGIDPDNIGIIRKNLTKQEKKIADQLHLLLKTDSFSYQLDG
jgi:hypothetical protein